MSAKKYSLRILTSSSDPEIEIRILKTLEGILDKYIYHVSKMQSYWKFDGWGELGVDVQGIEDIEAVKTQLADKWEGDVADRRWTKCCDDAIMFLWLSEW